MSITAPTTTMTVGNVIDGEERDALSGATFEKHNPATGEVLQRFAATADSVLQHSCARAAQAFASWRQQPLAVRSVRW